MYSNMQLQFYETNEVCWFFMYNALIQYGDSYLYDLYENTLLEQKKIPKEIGSGYNQLQPQPQLRLESIYDWHFDNNVIFEEYYEKEE